MALRWEVYCIVVESTAYQSTLLYWFDIICREVGITGITFLPIYSNTVSKNSRIVSGLKAMQTSEIILHPTVTALVHTQIRDWNPLKRDNTDDILDAIAHTPKVLADYTYDIAAKSNLFAIETDNAVVVEDNHAF